MQYTKDQFQKLPKWAQEKISHLENNFHSLEVKLRNFAEQANESNTCIRDGLDRLPLQNNTQVEFKTGEGNSESATVYVNRQGEIDVNTDSRRGKMMVIMPRASNSFLYKICLRYERSQRKDNHNHWTTRNRTTFLIQKRFNTTLLWQKRNQ